jgi:hypothetical protein
MKIFLSYASEDRSLAEEIQLALLAVGHTVFFDKASLPPGGDYHSRIEAAVKRSDLFVFLVSSNSVAHGSYALTELKFARLKWPHPKERVLPVRLHGTAWEAIPPYLKSVTVLEPEGNNPAEIVAAVTAMQTVETATSPTNHPLPPSTVRGSAPAGPSTDKSYSVQIWIALIGLVSALGVALIANWSSFFAKAPAQAPHIAAEGMKGPDTGNAQSQTLNVDCPETTEYDYSKIPPESKIVKRCPPQ